MNKFFRISMFSILQICVLSYIASCTMFNIAHFINEKRDGNLTPVVNLMDIKIDWFVFWIVFFAYLLSLLSLLFLCFFRKYKLKIRCIQLFLVAVFIEIIIFSCWVVFPQYSQAQSIHNHDGFRIFYLPILIPLINVLFILFILFHKRSHSTDER